MVQRFQTVQNRVGELSNQMHGKAAELVTLCHLHRQRLQFSDVGYHQTVENRTIYSNIPTCEQYQN